MHYASFIDALDSRGVQLDTRTPVSDLAEESVASLAHHTPDRYGPETFHGNSLISSLLRGRTRRVRRRRRGSRRLPVNVRRLRMRHL